MTGDTLLALVLYAALVALLLVTLAWRRAVALSRRLALQLAAARADEARRRGHTDGELFALLRADMDREPPG